MDRVRLLARALVSRLSSGGRHAAEMEERLDRAHAHDLVILHGDEEPHP